MADIKYKTISCGPAGSFQPGDVRFDVSDEEASALVRGGYADDVTFCVVPVREQAIAVPPEHAVSPAQPVTPPPGRSTPPRRGSR
jgi:hypothetical protein